MRTRSEDNKEDEDEGQQGGRGTTTRMWDKDVENEGQQTTRRDEYKGNKDENEYNKDEEDQDEKEG